MKQSIWIIGVVFLAAVVPVHAGLVVDHQPRRVGGAVADTSLFDLVGQPIFQRAADDILLPAPATIRAVSWWGFYGSFEQSHEPPLGDETMRVRFYGARPGDGLPNEQDIIFEESFLNPSRTATGEIVGAAGLPNEFLYEVQLTIPISLQANTPYWVEMVQIGDVDSSFLIEFSETDLTGIAFINPSAPDWQSGFTVDLAFQLSTIPEPASAALWLIAVITLFSRGGRKS